MTSPFEKLKAFVLATYPHNLLLSVFVFLGVAMGKPVTLQNAIFAFVVWWHLVSSIIVLNVITDWRVDTINGKNKLVHKNLSKRELNIFFIILAGVSLILSLLGTLLLQLAVVISLMLGIFYSLEQLRLKEILFINYVVMGLTWGSLATLIGLAVSTSVITALHWQVLAIMGIYIFIASQVKDFEDVEGDKNGSTLPKLKKYYTPRTYVALNCMFFLILLLLLLLNYLPFEFIVPLIVLPGYVIFFIHFLSARTREEFRRSHMEAMLLNVAFVLAFIVVFLI